MWRVLFDANIFISYLINPGRPTAIKGAVDLFFSGEVQSVITSELLREIREKSSTKPDLVRRIDPGAVDRLIKGMLEIAELVSASSSSSPVQLRDIKDTYLLRAAEAGDVDVLVTGDRDLLVKRDEIARPLIVTAAELLVIWEEGYNK